MTQKDWFSLVEAAVHKKIAGIEVIKQEEKQMSFGNDRILAKGFSYFFRSKPGSYTSTKISATQIQYVWHIVAEIYVKFDKDLENTWMNFRAFRADVDNVIQHDNHLDKTQGVIETACDGTDEPAYMSFEKDDEKAPIFIIQTLDISVLQNVPRERR